jgi:hypothetical protein
MEDRLTVDENTRDINPLHTTGKNNLLPWGRMVRQEYMAGCTCGLTSYLVVYEIDEEDPSAPRRIIIRCRNCGRVRFLLQEKEEELWYLHDRLPSGREQF